MGYPLLSALGIDETDRIVHLCVHAIGSAIRGHKVARSGLVR